MEAYEMSEHYIVERLQSQVVELLRNAGVIEVAGPTCRESTEFAVDVADLDCAPLLVQGCGRRWRLVRVAEWGVRQGRSCMAATYVYVGLAEEPKRIYREITR